MLSLLILIRNSNMNHKEVFSTEIVYPQLVLIKLNWRAYSRHVFIILYNS